MGTDRAFRGYDCMLTNVAAFKYLVRILTATDYDWPEVVSNLWKSWKNWERMMSILVREVAYVRISGTFFEAAVQVVLLFGSKTWVVTPRIIKTMGGFQHRVFLRLLWKQPWLMPYDCSSPPCGRQ